MAQSPRRFAKTLTQAIKLIVALENKKIGIIQDELGYALGHKNSWSIKHWRKGHNIPPDSTDVRILAEALSKRGGLHETSCRQFLRYADYLDAEGLVREIFGEQPSTNLGQGASLKLQPFVVGPPITEPRQFFGRERELRRIFGSWGRTPLQNIALVGPRRSGKTSLLHYLRQITTMSVNKLRDGQRTDWLKEPQQYRWAVVDFQDPRLTKPQFLLPHLLRELNCPIPTPCTLESFMDVMVKHLDTPTIILMDELAAALASPELDMAFWWSLRSLVNYYANGRLAFLTASYEPPFEMATNVGKPSPFFNMFNLVNLGPFTEDEARELIASSPIAFPAIDVHWILQESGKWPIRLQILCHERLLALEENLQGTQWKQDALQQLARFNYLME